MLSINAKSNNLINIRQTSEGLISNVFTMKTLKVNLLIHDHIYFLVKFKILNLP